MSSGQHHKRVAEKENGSEQVVSVARLFLHRCDSEVAGEKREFGRVAE